MLARLASWVFLMYSSWHNKKTRRHTAVRDDAFSGVSLAVAGDGGEADQVGLRFDEFSQIVGQQLPLLDGRLHGNLLLPPARLTHLKHKDKPTPERRWQIIQIINNKPDQILNPECWRKSVKQKLPGIRSQELKEANRS